MRAFALLLCLALSACAAPTGRPERVIDVTSGRGRRSCESREVLLRAISYRLVRALLLQLRRGTIASPGKVRGVRLWEAVA